ncbi:MAG TPA: hypothetical protein VGW38_13255 [Chloroflexota bacterium]|nr:hypothetical protein [Chloroflexota bacterium]
MQLPHLDEVVLANVGEPRPVNVEELPGLFDGADPIPGMEARLGEAGFYDHSARPYDPPRAVFGAGASQPQTINATRQLWVARFGTHLDGDIGDAALLPWNDPVKTVQPRRPNGWWISSEWAYNVNDHRTGNVFKAILHLALGDLVLVAQERGATYEFVGLTAVCASETWWDDYTDRGERRACLLPLAKFAHPVPLQTARSTGRLKVRSLAKMPSLGESGGSSPTLNRVSTDDIPEILSVCGIPPSVLAERDSAVIAARLAATAHLGNRDLYRLRYDAVVRHQQRRLQERTAEIAAQEWAVDGGFTTRGHAQEEHVPNSGFDLLVVNPDTGARLQIECKGYRSPNLTSVKLQPSQALRAQDAAVGRPDPWILFALTEVLSNPVEHVVSAANVVLMLNTGKLQIARLRGGKASKPLMSST